MDIGAFIFNGNQGITAPYPLINLVGKQNLQCCFIHHISYLNAARDLVTAMKALLRSSSSVKRPRENLIELYAKS